MDITRKRKLTANNLDEELEKIVKINKVTNQEKQDFYDTHGESYKVNMFKLNLTPITAQEYTVIKTKLYTHKVTRNTNHHTPLI